MPDRGFSFSIEDFLYAAHRLGIVNHLYWVSPPHVSVSYTDALLTQLQQMDGITVGDLANFRETESGCIVGSLLGLPITVCSYANLPSLDLPSDSLVDIDADFFIEIPGDEVWVSPVDVVREVKEKVPDPDLVTISRSSSSGFTPPKWRFLADCVAQAWHDEKTVAVLRSSESKPDQGVGR